MDVSEYFEAFTRRDWQTITDGRVRVAVVGLGSFARTRALPAIDDADFCECTVLVSGSPDKAAETAAEFDVDHVLDYEEFVDGAAVDAYDAVYVATPPAFHREYVEAAASLGKPVLCEKPLARSADEAERMVAACDDAGVTLMTAYRLRMEPSIRRVRELLRDGAVGEPLQVTASFSTRLLDHVEPDSWRLNPEIAGGGALLDLGVYPLNHTRFLLDEDPTAVYSETSSRTEPFADVDEHVTFQLSFGGGPTASCAASLNAHPDNRLQVLGSDGLVLLREPFGGETAQELCVERGDTETRYVGPPVDEVREEFDYFAHCVLTGEDCETDGGEGLADLRVVDAAYESAETGERVEI